MYRLVIRVDIGHDDGGYQEDPQGDHPIRDQEEVAEQAGSEPCPGEVTRSLRGRMSLCGPDDASFILAVVGVMQPIGNGSTLNQTTGHISWG